MSLPAAKAARPTSVLILINQNHKLQNQFFNFHIFRNQWGGECIPGLPTNDATESLQSKILQAIILPAERKSTIRIYLDLKKDGRVPKRSDFEVDGRRRGVRLSCREDCMTRGHIETLNWPVNDGYL